MALPREKRLRNSRQFNQVREQGTSRTGRLLIVACLMPEKQPEGQPKATQCGFTLSKKLGDAVERNFTRRRLRQIAREAEPRLLAGVWLVTIPKRAGMAADFAALRSEWRYLAKKLGVLLKGAEES
jgi:ribonuclease P protein component